LSDLLQDNNPTPKPPTPAKISRVWKCDDCSIAFPTKKELIEHLIDDYEWASQEADAAEYQLDNLKKNWRDDV
jgi:hypothetical protein